MHVIYYNKCVYFVQTLCQTLLHHPRPKAKYFFFITPAQIPTTFPLTSHPNPQTLPLFPPLNHTSHPSYPSPITHKPPLSLQPQILKPTLSLHAQIPLGLPSHPSPKSLRLSSYSSPKSHQTIHLSSSLNPHNFSSHPRPISPGNFRLTAGLKPKKLDPSSNRLSHTVQIYHPNSKGLSSSLNSPNPKPHSIILQSNQPPCFKLPTDLCYYSSP